MSTAMAVYGNTRTELKFYNNSKVKSKKAKIRCKNVSHLQLQGY